MKTSDEMFLELVALDLEFSKINDDSISYFDVCQKLHDAGPLYQKSVNDLNAIIASGNADDISKCVTKARFTIREQGLLMLEASRRLSGISAKCLALSERMAAITAREPL